MSGRCRPRARAGKRGETGPTLPWEQTIELADAALYRVKHNGRNNWAVLRPARDIAHAALVERIRDGAQAAIDDGTAVLSTGQSAPAGGEPDAAVVDTV